MSAREIIAAGYTNARCIGYEFCKVGQNNTPAVALGFRMSEGQPDEGRTLTVNRFLTDAAYQYTIADLRTLGWTGDDLSTIVLDDLQNEVSLKIGHGEYEGKLYAEIEFINPIGGGMLKAKNPMTPDELKRFAASMRTKVRAVGGGRPAKKPDGPQGQTQARQPAGRSSAGGGDWDSPPPRTDDDIPFLTADPRAEPSVIASIFRRSV